MYKPVPLQQRVRNAQYIVLGKVIGKETYPDAVTGYIYTLNRLQVSAWLKNRQQTSDVYVVTLGGIYGDRATIASPSLQLSEQQEYVLFLDKQTYQADNKAMRRQNAAAMQVKAYADAQGALPLQFGLYRDLLAEKPMDETTLFNRIQAITRQAIVTPSGTRFAARRYTAPASAARVESIMAVSSFSPTTTPAGTVASGDYLTITGSGFGASPGSVAFPNGDDGGSSYIAPPVSSDYVSWSDNSITVKVPSNAGTGVFYVNGSMASGSSLTIPYSHTNLYHDAVGFSTVTRQRVYLRNTNGLGGYTFQYNTDFNSNTSAVAAFQRALVSWRTNTNVNFQSSGTTSVASAASDGVNAVFFDATLGSGTLGQTVVSMTTQGSGACQQENTVWYVRDIDMRFNPAFSWNYSTAAPAFSEYDFESVALHELGHALGLGHVIASGQVMHYAIANGAMARTLSANDIAGGNAKMTYSTAATCYNPGGTSPMVLAVLPTVYNEFEGRRKNSSANILQWTTEQDPHTTGYYVQRSANGQSFTDLAFVPSQVTGSQKTSYAYEDMQAGALPWHYRIKDVNSSGQQQFSHIVLIGGNETAPWRIWSSTTGNTLYASGTSNAVLKLYSTSGQLVFTGTVRTGLNTISLTQLPGGIYFYNIITPSATYSEKIVLGGY